jgi:hypothetical protein
MKTSWLETHLETFVKPHLGYIPKFNKSECTPFFTQQEHTVIKNCWRSVKSSFLNSGLDTLVLPGRDVFIFEILAQREGFNKTLFLPQCSRMTVHSKFIKDMIPNSSYILDTGFAGTIPKSLEIEQFRMISASSSILTRDKQIFQNLTNSRSLALKIEKTPKYWKPARILIPSENMNVKSDVFQEFSSLEEFDRAAILTIEIYTNSSPSFISQRAPIGNFLELILKT